MCLYDAHLFELIDRVIRPVYKHDIESRVGVKATQAAALSTGAVWLF